MILQLNPPLPLVTPKGPALAHFMIDTGIENDIQWVCFQDTTGECWTWKNSKIRAQKNITQGRDYVSPFYDPEEVKLNSDERYFCHVCQKFDECACEEEDEYEEDEDEITYKELFMNERVKFVNLESELNELKKEKNEIEKKACLVNQTKNFIFELQDLFMRLIRNKKIDSSEWNNIFNILRSTGIEESDIKVLALGKIGY